MKMLSNMDWLKWLQYFAHVMLISGLIGFFGSAFCSFCSDGIPAWINLPLGDVGAIAVDSQGVIYCSSQGYYRIQQYSASGRFLRGWASPYKNPKLVTDKNDRLHVSDYSGTQVIYDNRGGLIPGSDSALLDNSTPRTDPLVQQVGSTVYMAVTPNIWPRVAKITSAGEKEMIINTSFIMWMIAGPLPGWLRAVLGMILLKVHKRLTADECRVVY